MPRGAYEALRDEERALPLAAAAAACVAFATVTAVGISLGIVFPAEPADRPFCRERRMLEALPAAASSREEEPEAYRYRGGAFYMTTAEAADFYWMVVLVPSAVLFAASAAYLVAGISVAYAAPRRHPFICIVENNFCASRRGHHDVICNQSPWHECNLCRADHLWQICVGLITSGKISIKLAPTILESTL